MNFVDSYGYDRKMSEDIDVYRNQIKKLTKIF